MIEPECDVLLEASWEVCNKVGGIYTVVKSKAEILKSKYQDYILIGPYFDFQAKNELQNIEPPAELQDVFSKLRTMGIICHYGKWLITGEPNCILIETNQRMHEKDRLKKDLWDKYQVDSINAKWDFEEPMIWGEAVGILMHEIANVWNDRKIVGHFHEWLAGFGILHLKSIGSRVATVFTTHATMLGRSIAGSGRNLFKELHTIKPDEEARSLGIIEKYTTEKASANACDVFTTVSETTANEAKIILGRKPEILVLNGLDFSVFPNFVEGSVNHVNYRSVIREFVSYFFFPHYSFDLNETLNFFIVGRNEFRNKGVDIAIRALGGLNELLKKENSKKHVAAFFWIPNETHGIKKELLENKTYFRHIRDFINRNQNNIGKNILTKVFDEEKLQSNIFPENFEIDLKVFFNKFKREGNPGFCTHYLPDENSDSIIKGFKENGLLNQKHDRVKVILYPVYLDGSDGLLDLNYYDAITGSHLAILPSFYEPWGYTPLESAALGVPAITSDTSGYGKFVKSIPNYNNEGIFVLDREKVDNDTSVQKCVEMLYTFTKLSQSQRATNKIKALTLAKEADWKILADNYVNAHNMALKNT